MNEIIDILKKDPPQYNYKFLVEADFVMLSNKKEVHVPNATPGLPDTLPGGAYIVQTPILNDFRQEVIVDRKGIEEANILAYCKVPFRGFLFAHWGNWRVSFIERIPKGGGDLPGNPVDSE